MLFPSAARQPADAQVQRRFAGAWKAGSVEDQRRAAKALDTLMARKTDVDKASRERDERKDTLRRGGATAAALVWVPALDASGDNPGGVEIAPLRSVDAWRPSGKTADLGRMRLDLARHLYGRYPTPRFLDAMWMRAGEDQPPVGRRGVGAPQPPQPQPSAALNFAAFWKAAATGTSLHKACMAPRGLLSRKETHLFLQAPDWCTVPQAIWWARTLSMSGRRSSADLIARSRIPDWAGDVRQAPDRRWVGVARFFAMLEGDDVLRGDELSGVLDWIRTMMADNAAWGIEGRTPTTVRRSSKAWHTLVARQREWSDQCWDGYPIDPWSWEEGVYGKPNHRVWQAEQILNGKALAREGHAQHHCVGSYLSRCRRGDCAIISLTVAEYFNVRKRALTIEIDRNWRIVQAKGFANRAPTGAEHRAMSRWAAVNGITVP